jgi:protein-S-isoprenylcysteine O-methyltransferase Ste14
MQIVKLQPIIFICWIIFFTYWFISARSVKAVQETKGWLGGNWYPILLLLGLLFVIDSKILGRFGIPIDTLAILLIPHSVIVNMIGVLLALAGLLVAIIARRTLAKNWSAEVAIKEEHELITTGIYSYIRNPIYSGILLMVAGTVLSFDTRSAGIGFLLIGFTIWLKLKQEEALLAKHFSEKYLEYKKRTKALIPFIL